MEVKNIKNKVKLIFSIVLGALSTFAFVSCVSISVVYIGQWFEYFLFFFPYYASFICFLIFWNIKKSRLVYLLLILPGLLVVAYIVSFSIDEYRRYINSIPQMYEGYNITYYEPFRDNRNNNKLAVLGEESSYKLTDNLPILDGATAFYPVYASFVQEVYPKDYYPLWTSTVRCTRTPNAYNNLLKREADLIFCLEPSEAQRKQFEDEGLNLKLVPIGREAFVFFVNVNNSVYNLTVDEVREIYSGRIKNWKKVGGKYQRIRAYQRPAGSGSQTILEKIMGDTPIMEPKRENVQYEMGEMINEVADYRNYKNALGYSFLFFSTQMVQNNQIRILSINGIVPERQTIQNGSYPFTQNIYAIYIDREDKNENIEPFIEWMLSDQGQKLILDTGYVPVN